MALVDSPEEALLLVRRPFGWDDAVVATIHHHTAYTVFNLWRENREGVRRLIPERYVCDRRRNDSVSSLREEIEKSLSHEAIRGDNDLVEAIKGLLVFLD